MLFGNLHSVPRVGLVICYAPNTGTTICLSSLVMCVAGEAQQGDSSAPEAAVGGLCGHSWLAA